MDNLVFVEFIDDFCFVKDRETRLVLCYRVAEEGLYQLVISTFVSLLSQSCHVTSFQGNTSVKCQSSNSFQV